MAQNPLPPPPPSGSVLDGWLYLLWRRLTQSGQILWESITPGTSADVAAAVTDETGSPGSLVFSGNPTLQGVAVDGLAYVGDTTAAAGFTFLDAMFSTDTAAGTNIIVRKCTSVSSGNTASASFLRSRGTAASPETVVTGDSIGGFIGAAFDGTNYKNCVFINFGTEGTVSTGIVPGNIQFLTANSSGTLTQRMLINSAGVITLGEAGASPAIKVTPVASQARWVEVTGATSSTDPTIGTSGGNLACSAVFMPKQATTAGAPAYVLGGMYYDTTLNKLRIGGATAWETVTSI